MDIWALVSIIEGVPTVGNIIVADNVTAQSYSNSGGNSGAFDYVIDITAVSQRPSLGWIYNAGSGLFSPSALPGDAYGNVVQFSTDNVTDIYTVNAVNYSFPHGTPRAAAYLSIAIQENCNMFAASLSAWVEAQYSIETRLNLNAVYLTAVNAGNLPNRVAYVFQLMTWATSVTAYASTYIASVKAQVNPASVAAMTWDFTQIDVPNPLVTALAALAINN